MHIDIDEQDRKKKKSISKPQIDDNKKLSRLKNDEALHNIMDSIESTEKNYVTCKKNYKRAYKSV